MEARAVHLTVDVKKVIIDLCNQATKSIDFAYPGGHLKEERAHAALMRANSTVEAIKSLMESIEEKKAE